MEYQNIIFDLGGVIIRLDINRTVSAFMELTGFDLPRIESFFNHPVFHDYEKGLISSHEFRQGIRQLTQQELEDDAIDKAWNAMIMDVDEERYTLLERLAKKGHRMFVLSNTNTIHLNFVRQAMDPYVLEDYFETTYYSHVLNARKPDLEIYQMVLDKEGLTPSETVFLDDNKENLKGAERAGIQTIWVPEYEAINTIFNE